jgi:hypothetical protein
VLKNHLASVDQNSADVSSIHALPQTRRDGDITANINTSAELLMQLDTGAARVKTYPVINII